MMGFPMRRARRWIVGLLLGGGLLALALPMGGSGKGHPLERSGVITEAAERSPSPAGRAVPSFDLKDQAVIREGAALFAARCTGYCHGKEGGPARAPRLRGRTFDRDYLFNTIANGVIVMPAWRGILSDEEIWKIVAYILSLSNRED